MLAKPSSPLATCLLLLGVLDGLGEVGQSISHLSGSDVGRGVLESLGHGVLVDSETRVDFAWLRGNWCSEGGRIRDGEGSSRS